MGLLGTGIALVVIGLLLALFGFFGVGGVVQTIGWVVLGLGVVLAIIHALSGATRRTV